MDHRLGLTAREALRGRDRPSATRSMRAPSAAQALVDPLVAAVDLADVADLRGALGAQSAAMSIAMPARMSGLSTRSP